MVHGLVNYQLSLQEPLLPPLHYLLAPWLRSLFKARDDLMPGSPYFDETPRGILTWPKLLKIGIPIAAISIFAGWHFDILIELMLVITGALTILAITRR
jgi:hypothetical protein